MTKPQGGKEHGRTSARARWNQRAFVVLGAALCGLALPFTGLADHAARGSRPEVVPSWAAAHGALGALFVGFCVWHAILNRRALLRYLRRGSDRLPSLEALAALTVITAVVLLLVGHGLRD